MASCVICGNKKRNLEKNTFDIEETYRQRESSKICVDCKIKLYNYLANLAGDVRKKDIDLFIESTKKGRYVYYKKKKGRAKTQCFKIIWGGKIERC